MEQILRGKEDLQQGLGVNKSALEKYSHSWTLSNVSHWMGKFLESMQTNCSTKSVRGRVGTGAKFLHPDGQQP